MSLRKPRMPGSIEDALARICGQLGFDDAGRLLGHASGSRLRQCADPEQDAQIHLRDAAKLDRVWVEATGEAPPLATVYLALVGAGGASAHAPKPPAARVLELCAELGELSTDVAAAMEDARLSPREHATLAKDLRDLVKAATRLGRDLDHFAAAGAAKHGGR